MLRVINKFLLTETIIIIVDLSLLNFSTSLELILCEVFIKTGKSCLQIFMSFVALSVFWPFIIPI